MANFIGGSAPAMANQVVEGYVLLSGNILKGFTPADLGLLRSELDKLLRTARAEITEQDDALASQARNRKIGRLNSAMKVISHKLTEKR